MIILLITFSFVKKVISTKKPAISALILGSMLASISIGTLLPKTTLAEQAISGSTICRLDLSSYEVAKKVKMIITAYSSTPEQTDDTPFITASGKMVADGIIANNMLPFGAKIRIPELYGDKIFVVEDRMHYRKGIYHADIGMPTYQDAKNFGAQITEIEILES